MFALIVLACVACASAAPGFVAGPGLVASPLIATPYAAHGLGAPLLPKVQVAPAQVTVVKQPYVVQQHEAVYRHVPVPVKAVAYTAPQVIHAAPAVAYAAPAVAYAAPAVAYAAPAVHYAAPSVYSHGLVGAHPISYNAGFVKVH